MKRAAATLTAAAFFLITSNALAAETAKQFIEHAYAPWIDTSQKRISDTDLMSTQFMTLWHADDAAAAKAGETGLIGRNLICNCQDGQMTALKITVRDINTTRATAHVTFNIDADPRDQIMILKMEQGRWSINDIIDHNKSLAAQLREDARMRQKRPARATN